MCVCVCACQQHGTLFHIAKMDKQSSSYPTQPSSIYQMVAGLNDDSLETRIFKMKPTS